MATESVFNSMRILVVALIMVLVLASCPYKNGRVYDAFHGKDKEAPQLLKYTLVDNSSMRLVYNEDVTLIDIRLNDTILDYSMYGTIFNIPFPEAIKRGDSAVFHVTAEDNGGNTAKASLKVVGKNLEIPRAVINEVSIKGTNDSPDRVEILFLESGSSAGMIVADGLLGEENHMVILPDIAVNKNDIILIYWDKEPENYDMIYDNGRFGHIVYGESDTTLIGTNGVILLYEEMDGKIEDGLIYTTGESELSEGYGNNRTLNAARELERKGEWEGDPVSSSLVTSSRVIARLPGGLDTNSQQDFFITAPRESTFGYINQYIPYEE